MSSTSVSATIADETLSTDALQSLKQDPAVLDAQIRVENTPKKSSLPTSPEPSENSFKPQKSAEQKTKTEESETRRFEEMLRMQKAALLSLAPDQLDLLLSYAGVLRMQRRLQEKPSECVLCKKNGRPSSWYTSHVLKDNRGRVTCPVLRCYRCPVCRATGDRAHTLKYCPENRYGDRWGR